MNLSTVPSDPASHVTRSEALPEFGHALCVAPMIDVTDRHCRFFHRLLAPRAVLYSEMTTTGALRFGDQGRHLNFNESEHPVVLQLGGSEPDELAFSARLGEKWGYDEINLNCGCPSERVQRGAFGACLMREASLVADCIRAMQDAVSVPVTVKHRLGLDGTTDYGFVQDFVGKVYDAGCRVFIVHARHAILGGLSPKENREIPPLQYDLAAQLKVEFPDARFVLNGGLASVADCLAEMKRFDGVMLGRAAWHDPAILGELSVALGHCEQVMPEEDVIAAMIDYAGSQVAVGVPLRVVVKPLLGWFQGRRGARQWRRTLSDNTLLNLNDPLLIERAWTDLVGQARPEPA
ncbi:tRNA dihydrouridine(20/20a) synthase DusA [Orrella marina]|uniref:tRNA-dihydrouridine(20/20a) synthase n=2 Tax=Orrella marina TaxID=2163011 RepID=A0A2R4XHM5_9BURK|nr:tRNA dihydrouridine(20/20a) synthase DusA [Orrella marina]